MGGQRARGFVIQRVIPCLQMFLASFCHVHTDCRNREQYLPCLSLMHSHICGPAVDQATVTVQLDRQAVGGDRDAGLHLSAPLFFKSRCRTNRAVDEFPDCKCPSMPMSTHPQQGCAGDWSSFARQATGSEIHDMLVFLQEL